MSYFSQWGDMKAQMRHFWEGGYTSSTFGHFVPGSTYFVHSFLGYGSKSEMSAFVLGCTGNLQRNKLRADKGSAIK